MDIGMIGLGKMGMNLVQNMRDHDIDVVAYDLNAAARTTVTEYGARAAASLKDLVAALAPPRTIWVMVPAGTPTEQTISTLAELLNPDDIVIDGGNSYYQDSRRRAAALTAQGIHFFDAGTSGGMAGARQNGNFMIGGEADVFPRIAPLFQAIGEGFEVLAKSGYDYDNAAVAKMWNHGSVIRSWLMELAQNAFSTDPELSAIKGVMHSSGEGAWTVEEAIRLHVPTPAISAALMARYRSEEPDAMTGKVVAALRNQFGGHAVDPQ